MPITVPDVIAKKGREKITVLTAYDYPSGLLVDKAGIDLVLVGDSLGMVVLGYEDTLSVTMEEMLHHTKAVTRAVKNALVVGDMPFMSYQVSCEQAVTNAGRFLQEGRARAVKLEGGSQVVKQVKAIVRAGIPVMGHIGLTPQSLAQMGRFKVQGKMARTAKKLVDEAKVLEDAGCFSLILEAIPAQVAQIITESISIPTIGIGAGSSCDGQVLVFHDLVGLFDRFLPKFAKRYLNLSPKIIKAIQDYKQEVISGEFPAKEHSFTFPEQELEELKKLLHQD